MIIGHNTFLNDNLVIVEQVEQPVDKQDEGIKNAKFDDKNNNYEEEKRQYR